MVTQPNSGDRRRWYQIKNAAKEDDGPPEILIYGEIDSWFGVAAADFVRDMAAIDTQAITVRINSIGGDAFDGVAIGNAIAGHPAYVTGIVDGVAASIASAIAVKCDTLVMNENSQMMVHNAWAVQVGDANDMQKTADMLARQNNNIASIYASKSGGTVEDWLEIMAAETWMTAEEAVEAGLADSVIKSDDDSNQAGSMLAAAKASVFDLSKFRYPGRQAAPAPRIAARAQAPQPNEAEVPKGKEPAVGLKESLVEKFGLDADADDDAILAAVAAGRESTDDTDSKEDTPSAEPAVSTVPAQPDLSPDQVTAVAARLGLTVVDKSVHDQLVADVQSLNTMRAKQLSDIDDQTIRNALDTGRITPASAKAWREELGKNREGISNLLASMPENRALAVAGVGHGVAAEDTLDAEMVSVFNRVTGTNFGKDA